MIVWLHVSVLLSLIVDCNLVEKNISGHTLSEKNAQAVTGAVPFRYRYVYIWCQNVLLRYSDLFASSLKFNRWHQQERVFNSYSNAFLGHVVYVDSVLYEKHEVYQSWHNDHFILCIFALWINLQSKKCWVLFNSALGQKGTNPTFGLTEHFLV